MPKNDTIKFDSRRGTFQLPAANFDGGILEFRLDRITVCSEQLTWRRQGLGRYVASLGDLAFEVRLIKGSIELACRNQGAEPITLKEIVLRFHPSRMTKAPETDEYREFIHSSNFEQICGVKKVGLANRLLAPNPESSMVYILHHIKTGRAVLLSTLPPHRGDYVYFKAIHELPHLEGRFGLRVRSVHQQMLEPGAEARTSGIQVKSGRSANALLRELGRQWACCRKGPLKKIKTGWNTWDFWAGAFDSKAVFDNITSANKHFRGMVKTIVLDAGWEPKWGIWDESWKFPEGLSSFCSDIADIDDHQAGIWTSPLLVNVYTRLYRDRPDWFGRDENGQVVTLQLSYGQMAMLDITVDEAAKWLYDTYRRLKAFGFTYFKIDFTQNVLKCANFHDKTVSRGAIIRRVFEIIRKAVGDDAYILACGAPFESVTGLVDATRVSGDIHNFWNHVRVNAASIASNWWMHRTLWNNDPDFLIVRCKETCPNVALNRLYRMQPTAPGQVWLGGREMNLTEVKSYALLTLLSGGDLFLSDDLPSLNAAGIDLIKTVFANRLTTSAVPIDLFDHHDALPSVWVAKEKTFYLIGLFNWTEDPRSITLDLEQVGIKAPARAISIWDQKPLRLKSGRIEVQLEPRASLGLRIKKTGRNAR